jgi:hypothetical protein
MTPISKRDEIIEVVNKLFIYTDERKWQHLLREVFAPQVWFDMSSLGGGEGKELQATDICDMWEKGFQGIDAVHHQAGNFLVNLKEGDSAAVYCYAIASHYKKAATAGQTREFVGSYDIQLVLTDEGWRIDSFKYNLKYISGNAELK